MQFLFWEIGNGWPLWRSEVGVSSDFCLCLNVGADTDVAKAALGKQSRPQRKGGSMRGRRESSSFQKRVNSGSGDHLQHGQSQDSCWAVQMKTQ